MNTKPECPVTEEAYRHTTLGGARLGEWWPEQLNLRILNPDHAELRPTPDDFDYAEAFARLDYQGLKEDLRKLLTDSQEWWPADYGHYGPLFIRMAWHSAGTYRIMDGRGGAFGGNQRFAPVNSWPDNVNLDKARRLLWPVKRKYGDAVSWADLMILAANVAMESMGLRTFGFAGGREDLWGPEEDLYWGPESEWLAEERREEDGRLANPLAAVQMGLIYVNPEGPGGVPNALDAAREIRESFRRMGMNDEETVALIAGGHTFGKNHGAADPSKYLGPEPEAAPLEEQGLGWKNRYRSGKGPDTITSGLEGAWTPHPTRWDQGFLELLFRYDWNLVKSPAGAWQWEPVDPDEKDLVPDAHDPGTRRKTVMLTTDLALRFDPDYARIARRFLEDPDAFSDAFSRAWFKLTHRDLGPRSRYLGPEVPDEELLWQDPLPKAEHPLIGREDALGIKKRILESGVEPARWVRLAWHAAATYRDSDKRGGVNGSRIRLEPQRSWEYNAEGGFEALLEILERVAAEFAEGRRDGRKVSLADLIVLAGDAAVEEAARRGGVELEIPFRPGRTDARQDQTDPHAFAWLEPAADGFVDFVKRGCERMPTERMLIDRARQLNLRVPEMTVLVGGLRGIGALYGEEEGRLVERTGVLSHEFFVNLLEPGTEWRPVEGSPQRFEGIDRSTGAPRWRAGRVDLLFGSHSQLRAQAEYYAQEDKKERFVRDFAAAWYKVMHLDRFDLPRERRTERRF